MTERWRQGLGELDALEPSPDIWERAVSRPAEGPLPHIPTERHSRIVAGTVAALVAGAGVAVAFLALRGLGTAPGVGGIVAYRDPTDVWEISYPERFRRGGIPRLSPHPRVTHEGIWIANFDPPEPPENAGGPLYFDVPDNGVVVLVYQRFGGPVSLDTERDSSFPISFEDLDVVPGPYPDVLRTDTVIANGEAYTITVRTGPNASEEDRQAAADIVSSFRILPLEEGTSTGRSLTFFVLGPPDRYPRESVTRFDPSSDHRSKQSDPAPFYLVRVPEGFYALAWPGNLVGGYQDCEVTYDPASREFTCPNGARWALDGSVIEKPDPELRDDPLKVLLVRISLDGHVLVSPNVFGSDTELDLEMTGG